MSYNKSREFYSGASNYKEYKNSSLFRYLFIKLFDLDKEDTDTNKMDLIQQDKLINRPVVNEINVDDDFEDIDNKQIIKKLDVIKYNLKQAKIERFNFDDKGTGKSIELFYQDPDKYQLEDNPETTYERNIPRDKDRNIVNEYYPLIFEKLWETVHQLKKFFIFFGYNKHILDSIKVDSFLDNEYLKDKSIDPGINEIFTAIHRAELFNVMKFPKSFKLLMIKELKNLAEKNNILDNNRISEIKEVSGVLSYIHDLKMNYIKYYDFLTNIFKKYLSKPKRAIVNLRTHFKDTFKIFNNVNSKCFKSNHTKLSFVNFYKLILARYKFERLFSYFDRVNEEHISEDKKENDDDDEDDIGTNQIMKRYKEEIQIEKNANYEIVNKKNKLDEDDNEKMASMIFNEYELFIFALSMGPIEYIVSN